LKDDAELHQDIKKVMKVIIGLLKNRVKINNSSNSKGARIKKFIKE